METLMLKGEDSRPVHSEPLAEGESCCFGSGVQIWRDMQSIKRQGTKRDERKWGVLQSQGPGETIWGQIIPPRGGQPFQNFLQEKLTII